MPDLVRYPHVRVDHAGYVAAFDAELVEMAVYYKVRNHLVCSGDILNVVLDVEPVALARDSERTCNRTHGRHD